MNAAYDSHEDDFGDLMFCFRFGAFVDFKTSDGSRQADGDRCFQLSAERELDHGQE